jgi:HD superfamily phosphohydrolase YqeK
MDPNDLIDSIVDAIDYAEMARDTQGLNRARKLLNNDLRQAIDSYVQSQVSKALQLSEPEPAYSLQEGNPAGPY